MILCLQLSQSVPDSETIRQIQLPPPDMNLQPKQLCHVAGWGLTETGSGVNDLRLVGVSVVGQNVCRRQWSNVHLPANIICAGGYKTRKGFCNVSFLSFFGTLLNTCHILLYQNIKIFPFYRVILVVLWFATVWLLVLYLSEIVAVVTQDFPMSTQTSPSSVPGSTRLSVAMIVKYNKLIQSFASAYLHCILEE